MNKSYNINYCFLAVLLFQMYIYARTCSFKSLLKIFKKHNDIIYRQSEYRDIKFRVIYLKCCTSCQHCFQWVITTHCRFSGYFKNCTIFDDSNSRSISKPTNGKLKDLQKVIKYPNGATTSTSNLPLSAVVLPINTQQAFQRCFNVAFWLIRHGDVEQCHINVEATLNIWTLGFATSNKISIKFQRWWEQR